MTAVPITGAPLVDWAQKLAQGIKAPDTAPPDPTSIFRVRNNVQKMVDGGAEESEINEYLSLENVTTEQIRQAGQYAKPGETAEQTVERMRQEGPVGIVTPSKEMERYRHYSGQPRSRLTQALTPEMMGGGGSTFGSAGGPLGALLGGLGGRQLGEVGRGLEDVVEFPQSRQLAPLGSSLRESTKGLTGEAALETATQAGVRALPHVVGGPLRLLGKGLGVGTDQAKKALETMGRAGSEAMPGGGSGLRSAIQTGTGASRVVSRALTVMPAIGEPAYKQMSRGYQQLSGRFEELLGDIAGAHQLPVLGKKIAETARGKFKAEQRAASRQYLEMYRYFDEIGDPRVIPTAYHKKAAQDILGQLDQLPRTVKKQKGYYWAESKPVGEGFVAAPESLKEELRRIIDLGENITPTEFRALQKQLNRAARQYGRGVDKAPEFHIISEMQAAGRQALQNVDTSGLPEDVALSIARKISVANRSWAKLMDKYFVARG